MYVYICICAYIHICILAVCIVQTYVRIFVQVVCNMYMPFCVVHVHICMCIVYARTYVCVLCMYVCVLWVYGYAYVACVYIVCVQSLLCVCVTLHVVLHILCHSLACITQHWYRPFCGAAHSSGSIYGAHHLVHVRNTVWLHGHPP